MFEGFLGGGGVFRLGLGVGSRVEIFRKVERGSWVGG